MPPCFMEFSSRSSSVLVAEGPYHHQRTIMRASSGGFAKEVRRSATVAGATGAPTGPAASRHAAAKRPRTPHLYTLSRIPIMLSDLPRPQPFRAAKRRRFDWARACGDHRAYATLLLQTAH